MLLTYLDESMNHERYSITALIVPAHVAKPLASGLDKIVADFARTTPGIDKRAELHGHDLINGKREWAPLDGKFRLRVGVYMSALEVIAAHDVQVIVRSVFPLSRLAQRYPKPREPHRICLSHIIEQVDEYAGKHNELALMIADEVDGQDTHRRDLWDYQNLGTDGYKGRIINNVVDTLHFVPSHNSRLVQAADMVSYINHRFWTSKNPSTKETERMLWRTISSKIYHSHNWRP